MKKKVIFVDDSATVLMSADLALAEMVKDGQIDLITYSDPVKLLDDVVSGAVSYDLLITDINMPQMNGMDLVQQLKAIESNKLKPILALTTENSLEMKELGKNLGLSGWLSKPFSNEKIIMGIKRVLKLR
jgi:two-component system chemotaxis response regulator CheY